MPRRRLVASILLLLAACSDSQIVTVSAMEDGDGASSRPAAPVVGTVPAPRTVMDAGLAPDAESPGATPVPEMDARAQMAAPVDLAGRVVRADTGAAVAGAWVTTTAGASEVTDESGRFAVRSAPDVNVQFDVNANAFAPAHETVAANGPEVRITVIPWQVTSTFDASREALAEAATGHAVHIPTNALQDAFAVPQVGTVGVRLAAADLSNELGVDALPGDEREHIAFTGAMEVTLLKSGVDLQVRHGKALELRFPIHDAQAPHEVSVWSYHEGDARWVREGTATREATAGGRAYYRGFASHLSWWAVGTLCEDADDDVALCGQCGRACQPFEDLEPAPDAGAAMRYRNALGRQDLAMLYNVSAEFADSLDRRPLPDRARSAVFSSIPDAVVRRSASS